MSNKIMIDPGHGGNDFGASVGNIHEDDLSLSLSIFLGVSLRKKGFDVIFTRNKDFYLSPSDRLRLINEEKPDVFVSIHYNYTDNKKVHGCELYYRDSYDLPLAKNILKAMEKSDFGCRGYFQDVEHLGKHLAVLGNLPVAAVLIEIGYMSNYNDFKKAIKNHSSLAELLSSSIAAYFYEKETTQ